LHLLNRPLVFLIRDVTTAYFEGDLFKFA
jgi:hypothetical protein